MIAPFVAILSRVIYVQANPNAKDSYSQSVSLKYQSNNVETIDDLVRGHIYKLTLNSFPSSTDRLFKANAVYNMSALTYYNIDTTSNENSIVIEFRTNGIQLRDNSYVAIAGVNLTSDNLPYSFDFVYREGLSSLPIESYIKIEKTDFNVLTATNTNAYLDNAFEYSLQEFTKDNDIGVINFFGWFEGYFLDQNNAHNLIYLNFANWYMNFALLVSSSYLLFLALIWFVNYIRRILDKSMNQEYGGF